MSNPTGAMTVSGSGNQWYVTATADQGGKCVIAGPFDTQALAQKYLGIPF